MKKLANIFLLRVFGATLFEVVVSDKQPFPIPLRKRKCLSFEASVGCGLNFRDPIFWGLVLGNKITEVLVLGAPVFILNK